ncbi:MAG: hypothetical protein MJ069_03980 [Salinivirgaceae bacterium]|nr:hypothetical protein [Salinivirgaceae bacterium]
MLSIFKLKERFFKAYFRVQDGFKIFCKYLAAISNVVMMVSMLTFIALLIVNVGDFFSRESIVYQEILLSASKYLLLVTYITKYLHDFVLVRYHKVMPWINEIVMFLAVTVVVCASFPNSFPSLGNTFLAHHNVQLLTIAIMTVTEMYRIFKIINSIRISPSMLLAASFLVVIFIASGLFLLPSMHTQKLSYLDSLFFATSATCVTGMSTFDIAQTLTHKGYVLLLFVIQLGGIGVMFFTAFFAYAFTGTFSFKDRLLLKDVFSSDTMNDLFRLMAHVLGITFFFELIGTSIIYFSVRNAVANPLFFSLFHSISAFCNAGLSTLPLGLSDPAVAGNNVLYSTLTVLIILGGIGFPIIISLLLWLRSKLNTSFSILPNKRIDYSALHESEISNRIVIVTTIILLIIGTFVYFILERNASLSDNSFAVKVIKSFFFSASARTSGFCLTDLYEWRPATIVFTMILMWIGASPGSTGGGIKTTAFAIAVLSVFYFLRGSRYIEIGYRRIGFETISRVLTLITLSVIILSVSVILIMVMEPDKDPLALVFEVVAAFSTTGMSIVGTMNLGIPARILIIFLMFIGRIGPLALLSGLFISRKPKYSKYPYKNLTIN